MPFEFAFLDWLQQFHNPVLDALAVFLNYAGEHGEIWIAFTLLLLLFRRTRKAGCAMATALVLYLLAGDCILKPLFARPRPCDVNTAITILVKRPHGHSFPSGHTASAFAAAFALWLQNRKLPVCRRVAGGTRLDDLEPQLAYPLRRIGHRDAQSRVHGGVRRSEITPVHALRISARGHYAGETAQSQESRLRLAT